MLLVSPAAMLTKGDLSQPQFLFFNFWKPALAGPSAFETFQGRHKVLVAPHPPHSYCEPVFGSSPSTLHTT